MSTFDDIPGTVLFDAEQSRKGYHLNMFCMSLMRAPNREAFKADPSAYLDGFEPVEPILAVRDNALKIRIEGAMGTLRARIAEGLPPDEVRKQAAALNTLLAQAEAALTHHEASAGSSFFGAFTILLREGLEALLSVVAMLAFLRKVERKDALPYVHGGWIAALVAGVLTWGAGTYLIGISGASRELTEGFGSVLAAIILLWVGVWMHRKSNAQAWQCYVCDQLTHALKRRSACSCSGCPSSWSIAKCSRRSCSTPRSGIREIAVRCWQAERRRCWLWWRWPR